MKLSHLIAITLLFSGSRAFGAPPETMPIWRIQIYLEASSGEFVGD